MKPDRRRSTTTRPDYDTTPERYRLGMRLAAEHTIGESLYDLIARRLAADASGPVLDMGCGEGVLRASLSGRGGLVIGLDRSPTMLAGQTGPVVLGDASALPFADASMAAVVAVNVLDHLADPMPAIIEAHRVLRPEGLFVTATVSRHDSPELAPHWRPKPTTFDAEEAPGLVHAVFGTAEAVRWNAPLVRLPDAEAVRDYLLARQASRAEAETVTTNVTAPLTVTKRGVAVYARRL